MTNETLFKMGFNDFLAHKSAENNIPQTQGEKESYEAGRAAGARYNKSKKFDFEDGAEDAYFSEGWASDAEMEDSE
jgi:hypothetical protein